jgi:hypothetical protein
LELASIQLKRPNPVSLYTFSPPPPSLPPNHTAYQPTMVGFKHGGLHRADLPPQLEARLHPRTEFARAKSDFHARMAAALVAYDRYKTYHRTSDRYKTHHQTRGKEGGGGQGGGGEAGDTQPEVPEASVIKAAARAGQDEYARPQSYLPKIALRGIAVAQGQAGPGSAKTKSGGSNSTGVEGGPQVQVGPGDEDARPRSYVPEIAKGQALPAVTAPDSTVKAQPLPTVTEQHATPKYVVDFGAISGGGVKRSKTLKTLKTSRFRCAQTVSFSVFPPHVQTKP